MQASISAPLRVEVETQLDMGRVAVGALDDCDYRALIFVTVEYQ